MSSDRSTLSLSEAKPAVDPRLGEYVSEPVFAKMVGRHPRTTRRWRNEPDGLPYLPLGNEILIHIPTARDWLAKRIIHPNKRRRAA